MEIFKLLLQFGAIISGWIVVHKLSVARDVDKARREMIGKAADALVDDFGKLFTAAKDYHMKERDIESEDSIKMTLQDISGRINILQRVASNSSDLTICSQSFVELRKAITGDHFEDEHSGPIPATSNQLKIVVDQILRAKRSFQELKHKQFPPPRK